ncbi:restriction endonuclease subunit S [Brochothrix campestris]|uniref:Restriction endonuclease S subunit n=1 Tax=Brochothrix campestris FSL F6-1037 TaxID=1265861 RepID=W7CQG6_9LIST|nr:restriction endonuclease subunit S [Brochothrix campestris]EUJ41869.1 restriction endonuclease S subunit [Brochothrix campestris FSL F6-1037]
MANKITKQPEIRFKGFNNDWEQRKLSEVLKVSKEKNKDNGFDKNDVLSVSREYGTVNQIEYQGRSFAGADVSNYKVVKENDLIYTKSPLKGAPYGIFQNATINGIISPLYAVYHSTEIAYAPYVSIYLKNDNIATHYLSPLVSKGAKNTINVTDEGALEGKIFFPNVLEQRKISGFFKSLDDTIALQNCKLEEMQLYKKAMLQKMFPKNGEKVPEIRFDGFTDDWEQRKLGAISERVTRKNKDLESTLPLTISAQYGLVDQITYFNKQIASKDVSNYYLLEKGEFAYNKSYSKDYPWGAVKRLDNYDKGVLSTLYIVFKPTDVDSNFLVSYYDTDNWHREVSMRAAEGARNHGLLNITANDFFDTDLTIPTNNNEQQKIGAFFKSLDDAIALQNNKLNKLKEMKKALLQKMFV